LIERASVFIANKSVIGRDAFKGNALLPMARLVKTSLTVTRCDSYFWTYQFLILIFNNINLLIIINIKICPMLSNHQKVKALIITTGVLLLTLIYSGKYWCIHCDQIDRTLAIPVVPVTYDFPTGGTPVLPRLVYVLETWKQ
jgi:hypothetical protein